MDKSISASNATRRFGQLLRGVKAGRSYLVTNRGQPVARITPSTKWVPPSRGRASLLRRLRSQKVLMIGRWGRDELYE